MAESSSFFNGVKVNGVSDRLYDAKVFAKFFSSFIGNGVFPNPSTNLNVVGVNNNMSINIKGGRAWINGYFYENSNDLILNISNADGVLNRIDRVVIRLDFLNREIRAHIKKGSFATNPIAPDITRTDDIYELAIADIIVSAGVVKITQANITDLRLNSSMCGVVRGTVDEIDTTTLYNQLKADIEEKSISMWEWIEGAKQLFSDDFNTWFDGIKDALDGDVAGNLLNRIIELEGIVNNLKLESGSVMRPDGSTVEETLSLHKTSISLLQTEVGINRSKLITNVNNIIDILV